jgi:hypothetical protein
MQRGADGFTNAYLLLYALDAGLSLTDELLRLATGQTFLIGPRHWLAMPVYWVSVLALPFLALSPRLPRRLLLPLFASALWLNQLAAPLPLLLPLAAVGPAASACQAAFAALAYVWVRHRCGGPVWITPEHTPAFSWRHWAGTTAFLVFVFVPAVGAYTVLAAVTVVQVGTDGFVRFDRHGVQLDDRRYLRARDGREVRLVGMMHVGEGDAYDALVASFAEPGTVVLEEGLSDAAAVLEERLDYDGLAGFLGLESQRDLASYLEDPETRALPEWPVLRHADVDLAEFDPATLDWLERTSALFAGESAVAALGDAMRLSAEDPDLVETVVEDVFTRRNEHLIGEVDAALDEFERVVVPWGALHLPEIEEALLERGFALDSSQRRRLVSWSTIADAAR